MVFYNGADFKASKPELVGYFWGQQTSISRQTWAGISVFCFDKATAFFFIPLICFRVWWHMESVRISVIITRRMGQLISDCRSDRRNHFLIP
jgi:hypothetical protein